MAARVPLPCLTHSELCCLSGLGCVLQAAGRDDKDKQLPPVNLTLVSFAVTRKAYQRITERFVKEYQAATGQYVKFRLSFGGSGTQVCPRSPAALVV